MNSKKSIARERARFGHKNPVYGYDSCYTMCSSVCQPECTMNCFSIIDNDTFNHSVQMQTIGCNYDNAINQPWCDPRFCTCEDLYYVASDNYYDLWITWSFI